MSSPVDSRSGSPVVPAKRRYVPAVGPRLAKLLAVVFGLFALLVVDSVYLLGVRALEAVTGRTYQNWFYLVLFLLHLVLGALLLLPAVVFGVLHWWRARTRPNRRAVAVGYALLASVLLLLASGVLLTRLEGVIVVKDPTVRSVAWWVHVLTPVAVAWIFVLHRLAGKRIRWEVGRRWATVAAVFAGVLLVVQAQDPRRWNETGPASGEQYFRPSLARTATGGFIPARVLDNNDYCAECHADTHERWQKSAHRFSSFNNPPYLFSVRETRRVAFERDGDLQASRFCAGCHDPVVFFSGRFDDPNFDDVNDPTGQAGLTCSVCHSITHINSPRGNSDYTIEEPQHYPFAFSENRMLRWVNRQLIKAKPEFHKKTFLKPLHRSPEFCGSCHKVHLPQELNQYKWLRGQNHYDSFLLSGVSGHGVAAFYYPEKAEANCNGCHMKPVPSDDFGAKYHDGETLAIRDHLFPSANTAIAKLAGVPDWAEVVAEHEKFNEGVVRIDLFGVREGGTIDGALTAPLRPTVPTLVPGRSYLLEAVVRTLKLGHHLTQGTADSNEIWLEVTVMAGDRLIGKSGGRAPGGEVDPWSHFLNAWVLDREGRRIDRRNAQDIFVPLYDHQIGPGAADVIHYVLEVPPDLRGTLAVEVALRYRKFDTTYVRFVYGADFVNDLPVMTMATDRIVFPVGEGAEASNPESAIPAWQRWNDYGIGLLLKGGKTRGELANAEAAFTEVERLGKPDGPLNLARVYLAQGAVGDLAVAALQRAATFDPPPRPWTLAWLSALVDKQNGYLDEAIAGFEGILAGSGGVLAEKGFDFSRDYRLRIELGQTLAERARQERGLANAAAREGFLRRAVAELEAALAIDPENAAAHYNLAGVLRELGDEEGARRHADAFARYRLDDNARDRAVAIARAANPAADHAAEAIVLYDLQRPGAYELAVTGGAR
jgi:tetratricopeptide (TPR) repeat protein